MNANELFEEFLTYCKDYELEFGNLIIKNNENRFTLFKPTNDYLIYESRIGSARESGTIDNIDELVELATYTVGEGMIKSKSKNKYF